VNAANAHHRCVDTGVGHLHLRVRPTVHAQRIPLPVRAARRAYRHPALVFVYWFAVIIVVGAIVLSLPVASAAGHQTPVLDALFTATSAVCVTGLVVVDTGTYWSTFGQTVILLLIQLGGFGFMTSSTVLLLLLRREATLRERILLREALGGVGLGSVLHLASRIVVFTLIAEGTGAIILATAFASAVDPPQALWWGVFHAVSAFNNAGFDLVGGFRSLMPFNQRPEIVLTVACLIIGGGISYTVVEDLLRRHRFVRLTLDSKLVLVTALTLVVLGTVAVLFTERANPATLGAMSVGPRLLNAFFTSVTPRSAGFNTLDTAAMTESGLFVLIALMFIGGAAGSTAGGIKLQTFSLLLFAIVTSVRGGSEVEAFGRRVPGGYVLRAIAVALLALALVFVVSFALTLTEQSRFFSLVFESFSALGTVGLSTGITPDLSPTGRAILSLTMFAGRLGPLTLVLALAARERHTTYRWPEEGVKIG
jgi:trk system potassium uptake protein TrkH